MVDWDNVDKSTESKCEQGKHCRATNCRTTQNVRSTTIKRREEQRNTQGYKRGEEEKEKVQNSVPIGLRQLPHPLYLPDALHFGIDRFSQTLEVDDTIPGSGPHEQIHPDSSRGNGVVSLELWRTVETNDLLRQVIEIKAVCVWPGNADRKPPPE